MGSSITLHNIHHQETVHQRCLLVSGHCGAASADEGHIEIAVSGPKGRTRFPEQRWPMCQGHFKALAILEPGGNILRFSAGQDESGTTEVSMSERFRIKLMIVC